MTEDIAQSSGTPHPRERVPRKQTGASAEQRARDLYITGQELGRLVEEERRTRHQVEVLRDALRAFTRELEPRAVLELVGPFLRRLVPCDGLAVLRLRGDLIECELREGVSSAIGMGTAGAAWSRLLGAPGPVWAFDTRAPAASAAWGAHPETACWLAVPMCARERVQGWIVAECRTPGAYDEAHVDLGEALANEAAIALDNAQLFAEVQRLSVTDVLTGLANRRRLGEVAHREFQRAQRHDLALCAIMLDVDHFKRINDQHGHAAGDQVLSRIGAACRGLVRSTDIAARYGGEELCFVLPETDLDGGRRLAVRLRDCIRSLPFASAVGPFRVTASFGVAQREYSDVTYEDILGRADEALYQAKRAGRDKVILRRTEGVPSPTCRVSRAFVTDKDETKPA